MEGYYYAVSLTGYEVYQSYILWVPDKIPNFTAEVHRIAKEILLGEWNEPPCDYEICGAIALRLGQRYNGYVVETTAEYEWAEFTIHHITSPALDEVETLPNLAGKYRWPSWLNKEEREILRQRFVKFWQERAKSKNENV